MREEVDTLVKEDASEILHDENRQLKIEIGQYKKEIHEITKETSEAKGNGEQGQLISQIVRSFETLQRGIEEFQLKLFNENSINNSKLIETVISNRPEGTPGAKGVDLREFPTVPVAVINSPEVVFRIVGIQEWQDHIEGKLRIMFLGNGIGGKYWEHVTTEAAFLHKKLLKQTGEERAAYTPCKVVPKEYFTIESRVFLMFQQIFPNADVKWARSKSKEEGCKDCANTIVLLGLLWERIYQATADEKRQINAAVSQPAQASIPIGILNELEKWRTLLRVVQGYRSLVFDYEVMLSSVTEFVNLLDNQCFQFGVDRAKYVSTHRIQTVEGEEARKAFDPYVDYVRGLIRTNFRGTAENKRIAGANHIQTGGNGETPEEPRTDTSPSGPGAFRTSIKPRHMQECALFVSGAGCKKGYKCGKWHSRVLERKKDGNRVAYCFECGKIGHVSGECTIVPDELKFKNKPPGYKAFDGDTGNPKDSSLSKPPKKKGSQASKYKARLATLQEEYDKVVNGQSSNDVTARTVRTLGTIDGAPIFR